MEIETSWNLLLKLVNSSSITPGCGDSKAYIYRHISIVTGHLMELGWDGLRTVKLCPFTRNWLTARGIASASQWFASSCISTLGWWHFMTENGDSLFFAHCFRQSSWPKLWKNTDWTHPRVNPNWEATVLKDNFGMIMSPSAAPNTLRPLRPTPTTVSEVVWSCRDQNTLGLSLKHRIHVTIIIRGMLRYLS